MMIRSVRAAALAIGTAALFAASATSSAAASSPPPPPPVYGCADVLPIAGALGVYDTRTGAITLQAQECRRLELLAAGRVPRSLYVQRDLAEAVWLLAHEQAHAAGVADETAADCAGLRTFGRVAAAVGVRPAFARVLAGYAEAALLRECG